MYFFKAGKILFATYCTLQSVFSRVEYKHHGFLLIFLANYRIIFKSFFPLSSISAFLILHPLSVQILCLCNTPTKKQTTPVLLWADLNAAKGFFGTNTTFL